MFKLEIETDNAAFEGADRPLEIARILRNLADELADDETFATDGGEWKLYDVNGNAVGSAELAEREED